MVAALVTSTKYFTKHDEEKGSIVFVKRWFYEIIWQSPFDFIRLSVPALPWILCEWIKISETNHIPETRFVSGAKIVMLYLETFILDRINMSLWLDDDVKTYKSWSNDIIYSNPAKMWLLYFGSGRQSCSYDK